MSAYAIHLTSRLPVPCLEYMRHATPSKLRIARWKDLTALDFLISGRPILCPYKPWMLVRRRGGPAIIAPTLSSLWVSLAGSSRDRRRRIEQFARAIEGFEVSVTSNDSARHSSRKAAAERERRTVMLRL